MFTVKKSCKCYLSTIVDYLYQDCDNTALIIFRVAFGICLFLDVPQERGLDDADLRFGDPNHCFFPLFPIVQPVSVQYACILYSMMWTGSIGIVFGYQMSASCIIYLVPFLYFFLLDKSRWNNHSYLFGLIVILLCGSNADGKPKTKSCPKWNYLILKFQFLLLYFYAAIKKMEYDWLSGWSMKHLSKHIILGPIVSVLSEEFVDYYMIHLGGFTFDLTIGFLLIANQFTRKIGFTLSLVFHALNSQLFDIGMFPYVCLASLILFCETDEFPLRLFVSKNRKLLKQKSTHTCKHTTAIFLLFHILIQLTLPFTHSITKGYNNWTNGLYGYSWDMMVYSWTTLHTKITVRNMDGSDRYLDPDIWTSNDRWSSHADMAKQYASCIARNLAEFNVTGVEVYFDVWKSLNGRFQQRMFDPKVNILLAEWSPWDSVTWVLPLLHEFSDWRQDKLQNISHDIQSWDNSSNVIFVADYPGLTLENFLPEELSNVYVILMKGKIVVEQPGESNVTIENCCEFNWPQVTKVKIHEGRFHKIHTISPTPASYMYTFKNLSAANNAPTQSETQRPLSIGFYDFIEEKIDSFTRSYYLIVNSYLNVLFGVPMVLRKNVE